jgi:hypothetical protein
MNQKQSPDKYENALNIMREKGVSAWLHKPLIPYTERLYKNMIDYYVEREEYEKCSFVYDFWKKYQRSLELSKIFDFLSNKTDLER